MNYIGNRERVKIVNVRLAFSVEMSDDAVQDEVNKVLETALEPDEFLDWAYATGDPQVVVHQRPAWDTRTYTEDIDGTCTTWPVAQPTATPELPL